MIAQLPLVALVVYPLSFGPACWISANVQPSGDLVSFVYRPVLGMYVWGFDWLQEAIDDYASLGLTDDTQVTRIYMRGRRVCIAFE